jgi:hypothetical protein
VCPLSGSVFVADHLRPTAITAGVPLQPGQRFGLHNMRHSLSNWLVNKPKVEPKTVQGILRHSRIQTTLDFYTQEDSDEARAAQGAYLKAPGNAAGASAMTLWAELWVGVSARFARIYNKNMVGPNGLEPLTSTVSNKISGRIFSVTSCLSSSLRSLLRDTWRHRMPWNST